MNPGSDTDLMLDVYMTAAQREAYNRLRKDAERYRWLRTRWGRLDETYHGDSDRIAALNGPTCDGWDVDPISLDSAIDAAMNGANAN